jgi:hypothetical protein
MGEASLEEFESCARSPAEAVDSLIGIADGEDVTFGPGKPGENLDLREVGVLEFIGKDEAGTSASIGEGRIVVVQ